MSSPDISRVGVNAKIHNLVTDTIIRFRFLPEEVEDSHSSSFSQQEIQGRSTPILAYSGGGPREVSFSVTLFEDYCDDGIIDAVNKLKALTYPGYSATGVEPPECYVRIGDGIIFTGQCTNVSVSWQTPFKSKEQEGVPRNTYSRADVSLSFLIGHNIAKSSSGVEKWGDNN